MEVTHQGQSSMLLSPGFKGSAPPPATAEKASGTNSLHSAAQRATAEASAEAGAERASGSVGVSQMPSKIGMRTVSRCPNVYGLPVCSIVQM